MEHEIKKYLASVKRRLNIPRDLKDRCISDLQTTIRARLENGEQWPRIRESLGTPNQVAAELNDQMKEYAYRKSPWRFVFLALAVVCALWLAWYAGLTMFAQILADEAASIGVIGGADGPTAIFVTTSPGFDWDLVLAGAGLIAGIAGFLRLRRCRQKR